MNPTNPTARYAFGNGNPATGLSGIGTAVESAARGINASGETVGWRNLNGSVQAFYYAAGRPVPFPFPSRLLAAESGTRD